MSETLGRSLSRTAGFAGWYVLAAYAGRLTVLDAANLSLVWPAAGVVAVWAVVRSSSPRRWLDALALVLVTLPVNLATGASLAMAGVFAVANVLQATIFAVLFQRWLPRLWRGGEQPITRLAELWRFVAAAVLSNLAGALVGPTGVALISGHHAWDSVLVWLARNVVSTIVVGISLYRLIFLLRHLRAGGLRAAVAGGRPLECVSIMALSAAAYAFTFGAVHGLPVAFALIVLSVWAGVRLPTTFVILHALTVGTVAIVLTLRGTGPFAHIDSHPMRALIAQLFVGMVAIVGLALALGRDEREALLERLRDSERAAVEQARTLTTIVDSLTEGLCVVGADGRLLLRNPAAAELLGVTNPTGSVAEGTFYGLYHPDGTPLADEDHLFRQIFAGRGAAMDLLVRNAAVPDGRILAVRGAEIPADGTGERRALVVFHDVTADRRHRDELASFAGVVAHDLLNPVTTVEGWSEVLAAELDADDRFGRDGLARIQRAAARMRSLINGLLAYTTARDAALSPTAVRLDDLVRDVAGGRLDHAESTAAPVPRFDIGDLATVHADPVLTRQLLENLIGNAIKYTAPGVTPHITVRSRPTGDGFTRITVDDNGIGIPAGQHEAIFQNFHRAHAGGGYAGTGLGLAICKRIVERHGGTITAAGNDAGGSRMTVTLPLAGTTADAVRPPAREARSAA